MKRQILLVAVLATTMVFVAAAFSQDAEKELAPLPDAGALVNQLGAQQFAVRQQAETELLKLGERAVPVLREAMKSHEDAHVRFEAERILTAIAAAKAEEGKPDRQSLRSTDPFAEMERRMTELMRRMEAMGIQDEDLLEQMRKLSERPLGPGGLGSFFGGGVVSGSVNTGDEGIEYEQRVDGSVRVRITKDGETKEYEAESMDALEKEHPDVAAKVKPHFGNIRIRVGAPDWFPGLHRGGRRLPGIPFGEAVPGERERPLGERDGGVPAGFRLGVWVGDVSEALRSHLKLEENEGVLVEEIVPGSFAAEMGIRRLDVIRKANGETVTSAEDLRRIIGSVDRGGQVSVDVTRRGEPLSLMAVR